ncbi:hypothetical protein GCM10010440_55970 [Kitasatospora cinereorecta]
MGGVLTRSDRGIFEQRISPYPISTPRSTWERFNMAKTDSGWPLLIANLLLAAAAAGVLTYLGASRSRLFLVLGIAMIGHVIRTVYVMACVVRGGTDRLAPGGTAGARRGAGRHR